MNTISYYLRVIASRILLAHDLPETVVSVLEEFDKLFKDDSNFIDFEKWGKKSLISRKKIVPFSFSRKGFATMKNLGKGSKAFANLLQKGTAAIHDRKYDLLYFLAQYISVIGNTHDFVITQIYKDREKHPEKSEMLSNLEEKIKSLEELSSRISLSGFYNEIPYKDYTQEKYQKAKDAVSALIRNLINEFKKVKKLSPEEEKYFVPRRG